MIAATAQALGLDPAALSDGLTAVVTRAPARRPRPGSCPLPVGDEPLAGALGSGAARAQESAIVAVTTTSCERPRTVTVALASSVSSPRSARS